MELVQIGDDPCMFTARLPDLDQPIRRIFRLDRLLEAVRSREMGLIRPHSWDDPREDQAALCMLDGHQHVKRVGQRPLSDYLAPAWAQCWSLNPGSDTLLRAYSSVRRDEATGSNSDRAYEGVTVTTTIRHLLTAAKEWQGGADDHIVVGRVEYLNDEAIGQRIVNACNGAHGPRFFCSVQGRADSLMWKRNYFDHEQEVRLLMIARSWTRDGPPPLIRRVTIDPNTLFTSVSFDPRLSGFDPSERKAELREAGYSGEIKADPSYEKVMNILVMTRDWPDP